VTETGIDEVLDRFSRTGPEFGPGLSNHGPMGAEALVTMGRADVIGGWADWYAARLQEHPSARNPIGADDWREALGDIGRVGDWVAFFERELDARPWNDVLDTWVARLGPGLMAGATHGVLRTAHAVRTLASGDGSRRTHELAEGLGYWAARYQELPGKPGVPGALDVPSALAAVPRSAGVISHRGLIFETVKEIDAPTFAPAINAVAIEDLDEFVSGITRTFVRLYLANAGHAAIAFVHTVTAPSSLRILAPHLGPATRHAAARYAWQAAASIYAAYAVEDAPAELPDDASGAFDAADLIDQAVAARDEHAIKFTDACLREHAISGDPAFIVAARDVVVRMKR
jgi:Questin oxidase-like